MGLNHFSFQFISFHFNSIQFNSIQFNSIQFNSIQFNSIQFVICFGFACAERDTICLFAVLRVDNSSTSTYTAGREAREVKRREDECSVSQPVGQLVGWSV
jgi:hypothetical protein